MSHKAVSFLLELKFKTVLCSEINFLLFRLSYKSTIRSTIRSTIWSTIWPTIRSTIIAPHYSKLQLVYTNN